MILSKAAARRRKLTALTLSVSLLAMPQAHAFESVVVGTRHFFECLGLMLSNPDVHENECLPNRVVRPLESLTGMSSGPGAPIVVPPIVVPPPPPPVPDDPCVCGSCYSA